MTELRGMPVVTALAEKYTREILELREKNITPRLSVVRVGERGDDIAYERGIKKRFSSVGSEVDVTALPDDVSQQALEAAVSALGSDAKTHGILIFRPLPRGLDEERLKALVPAEKDVDCMKLDNLAHVFAADGKGYAPCTPAAVIELLDFYGVELSGKRVTVVGRSLVVGKPLAMMLLSKNATVTICHTRTKDIEAECRRADIIVACAGAAEMIGADYVSEGQTVIDVGINVVDGRLCGDVAYKDVSDKAGAITPVPGGVGTVTTSVLLGNTIKAAKRAAGIKGD